MSEIVKRAVVDTIDRDINGQGTINVRVSKVTEIDGQVFRENHRLGDIVADEDLDAFLESKSASLESEGFAPIEAESLDYVRGVAKLVRTPSAVAAAQQRREDARLIAEEAARQAETDRQAAEEAQRQAQAEADAELERRIQAAATKLAGKTS